MKKIAVYTLGCKVNQVESENLIEEFRQKGYGLSRSANEADICIINTCTVTHVSDRKSRSLIRRIARAHPDALLVVTGCLAELHPEQVAAIEGVNLVVGNQAKEEIPRMLEEARYSHAQEAQIIRAFSGCENALHCVLYSSRHRRTRAFIKIADGCESFCTYCIVPYARGPVRSKKAADIIQEISSRLSLGYREMVLTGINIGYYGCDLKPETGIISMLKQVLDQVPGDYRLRLGSINPNEIGTDLLELIAAEPRICRHLHVPLQSGSDRVLQLMGRGYDGKRYRDILTQIYRLIPETGVTTDVMTGFPGESRTDFEDTCGMIGDFPLLDLHVFRYSPRPGTAAVLLDNQVSEAEREERSQRLISLAADKKKQFVKNMLGKNWRVLLERRFTEGVYKALSDNYVEFIYQAEEAEIGSFVELQAVRCEVNGAIRGEKAGLD